jgi:hypothetical protein
MKNIPLNNTEYAGTDCQIPAGPPLPLTVMMAQFVWSAQAYPPINDVTTDPDDPPMFWDVPNPRAYPGPEAAELQREGYPDLGPLVVDAGPETAFEQA